MAKLNNCPTSPRKMRLVADQVRGKDVNKALSILKFSQKQASLKLEKLLLSAINNWQQKNPDSDVENEQLYVKEIKVDGAGMLKRLRPAPQGRACLLYTSDAADDMQCVDLGGRRIIKKRAVCTQELTEESSRKLGFK